MRIYDNMEIKPIKTDLDYQAALKEIEGLMDTQPDTPEGDRLDIMTTLVAAYEAKHYPIGIDHKELEEKLCQLWNYLICNSRDIEPEYRRIVEEHFWELLA